MRTEYRFIRFVEMENPGRKTRKFNCENRNGGYSLGRVEWECGWRQYCFSPGEATVFSKGCLEDVNDFIGQLMAERKK